MNNPEAIFWLALKRLPGIGLQGQRALLEHFGSPASVFSASTRSLRPWLEHTPETIRMIMDGPETIVPATEREWLEQPAHHLLTIHDPDYPPLLRELSDAPVALFVIGARNAPSRPQIAIVGSRNPTPTGRETAQAFAAALAQAGYAVTSGLARGIDAAAHEGALAAQGTTVAVTGTGLDRVYPAVHRELAHRIAATGALVSEFPHGTPPLPENFPIRNRIISGLSVGTLVVEAATRSGSLITARLAGEQGREVFAIPGSIHSPLSRGCHRLIRQGAKLVETAQDIIEELGPLSQLAATRSATTNDIAALEDHELKFAPLLGQLGYEPTSIDTLIERSGLTADVVSSMLLELELNGVVSACAGGRYMRRVAIHEKQTDG